jgi:uncharacterized membrane protein YfcA
VDWLWLILLGVFAGAYGVMVGAGGGFIIAPVLLIFFDLEPKEVAGTVLALVAINSVSGAVAYRGLGIVDRRSAVLFALAAIPGSVIAPFFLSQVAPSAFRIIFGLLMVGLSLRLIFRSPPKHLLDPNDLKPSANASTRSRHITTRAGETYHYQFNEALAVAFNFFLGFIASFLGIGGGFLLTPALVYLFEFPIHVAVATSLTTLALYTTAGAVTHASLGHVQWFPIFLFTGIGFVAGGQLGVFLTPKIKGIWIIRLLLVVIFILGVRVLTQGIQSFL